MSEFQFILLESGIKAFIIVNIILVLASVEVYLERKISAWIQNRIGPNRVGPFGLLQPIADVVKLFMKEDLVPKAAHKGFHRLAPLISLAIAIAVYAVIPYSSYTTVEIAGKVRDIQWALAPDVNIGVLFILAMTSLGVYGITLAGWSSNSKYSLLGGLRSAAQMISYELSMGLSLMGVIMIAGSLSINDIIANQAGGVQNWNILYQPIGFFIFLAAAFAETNRAPFDLPEAEPELVGGFNTEYSGMKFGTFFLAEYANMATSSAFITIMYFGGWQLPFDGSLIGLTDGSLLLSLLQFGAFATKVGFWIVFFIWVRWTVPRFRYDQLMNLGWKIMLPIAIVNVLLTAIGIAIFDM